MTTAKPETNTPTVGVDTTPPTIACRTPSETNRAITSDLGERSTALAAHNNLTLPRTPIIGRDHELAVIQHLLLQEQIGLLTLTAPAASARRAWHCRWRRTYSIILSMASTSSPWRRSTIPIWLLQR